MIKKNQFVCPNCGEGDAISERNIAHILYTVHSWTENGEPDDFGDREILDDTMRITNMGDDGHDRFVCGNCNHEFEEPIKPTATMFTCEDTPLFSNTPVKAITSEYKPRSVIQQPKLPTLCTLCLNTGFIDCKKCVCKEVKHD